MFRAYLIGPALWVFVIRKADPCRFPPNISGVRPSQREEKFNGY
jgi:hypothetical protein